MVEVVGKPYNPIYRNVDHYIAWQKIISIKIYYLPEQNLVLLRVDGGMKWIALKSGLPTIAVRDLEIQKRENDLVLGTFGRGFGIG